MDHILAVHICYRLNNLLKDCPYFVFIADPRTRSLSDVLIQIISVDIFNDNRDLIA